MSYSGRRKAPSVALLESSLAQALLVWLNLGLLLRVAARPLGRAEVASQMGFTMGTKRLAPKHPSSHDQSWTTISNEHRRETNL